MRMDIDPPAGVPPGGRDVARLVVPRRGRGQPGGSLVASMVVMAPPREVTRVAADAIQQVVGRLRESGEEGVYMIVSDYSYIAREADEPEYEEMLNDRQARQHGGIRPSR